MFGKVPAVQQLQLQYISCFVVVGNIIFCFNPGYESRGDFPLGSDHVNDDLFLAGLKHLSKNVIGELERLASKLKPLENASCGEILAKFTIPSAAATLREEAANANVGSLRVQGDRAYIIYRGADNSVLARPMTKEGGSWKVATLGSTPLL